MGAYNGTVIRPSTGKPVEWRLAPGLAKLGQQLDKLGITWYSIGDKYHLSRHGGHTPWRSDSEGNPTAPVGVVTAIDVMKSNYPAVQSAILKLMKTSSYDTTWIDFINVNYKQYDWNGVFQGPSGDGHLHLEILGNSINFNSNLFNDMFGQATKPTPVPISTPVTNVALNWEDEMLVTVKLRSRDDVWVQTPDGLQHLTRAQLQTINDYNARQLPSGSNAATRKKYLEPFVVENEEALAAFGLKIVKQTTQVEGLD